MRYAAILLTTLLVGCRTIWIHPEASAEKYEADTYFCQRGVERPDANAQPVDPPAPGSDRAFALEATRPGGAVRQGWKRCMVRLGWDTSYSGRHQRAWRTPEDKPLKGR